MLCVLFRSYLRVPFSSLQFVLPCLAVCVAMAHCAAIDQKEAAAAPAVEEGKTVEKRGLHLGDYHHHHHHEHIKTVTIEKKVPVPYTVTKHVPYTVEKKVSPPFILLLY